MQKKTKYGKRSAMNLDRLVERTGIKKSFLARATGYSEQSSFRLAERNGFNERAQEALLDALEEIRNEIDAELRKHRKSNER